VYAARSAKVGSPLREECGAFRKPATASGNLCKGFVVNPWPFTLGVNKGLASLGLERESRLVGKVRNLCRVL
jgi:hypothetical protein